MLAGCFDWPGATRSLRYRLRAVGRGGPITVARRLRAEEAGMTPRQSLAEVEEGLEFCESLRVRIARLDGEIREFEARAELEPGVQKKVARLRREVEEFRVAVDEARLEYVRAGAAGSS